MTEKILQDTGYAIGIDLGGTTIKFALVDPEGNVVLNDRVATRGERGHDAVVQSMADGAESLISRAPGDGPVTSVGVAVPGLIDMVDGVVKFLTNLPGHWPDVDVSSPMVDRLGMPAHLINDVRAFTLAELRLGAARGVTTGLFYAVGTGIGGGIVTHGQVNMGVAGAGGELGHLIVDPNGPMCGCGNRGCVEAFSAGPTLIGEANRRIVMGAATQLRDMIEGDLNRMTPELVEEAANQGDEIACEVLDYAGYRFGLGIAGAIAALSPEVVVLGGGALKPYGYYWQQIEKSARDHVHIVDVDRVEFRAAELGYESGVIGAALWGRDVVSGRATPER